MNSHTFLLQIEHGLVNVNLGSKVFALSLLSCTNSNKTDDPFILWEYYF